MHSVFAAAAAMGWAWPEPQLDKFSQLQKRNWQQTVYIRNGWASLREDRGLDVSFTCCRNKANGNRVLFLNKNIPNGKPLEFGNISVREQLNARVDFYIPFLIFVSVEW